MYYYRLIEKLPGRAPLGYGSAGGRWNSPGTPIIYACNRSSLNFTELLCIKGNSVSRAKWHLVKIQITGEIPYLDVGSLATDWKHRPYPKSTQNFGTQWAQGMLGLCLKVPSCRIPLSSYPEEHNLLINPLHPDRNSRIEVVQIEEIDFALN